MTGTHPEIKPFIIKVKIPVVVTPDQSYYLNAGEKVTAAGLETDASL